MKHKKLLVLFCLIAIGLAGLGLKTSSRTGSQTVARTGPAPGAANAGTKESPHPSQAPEHVIYRQFFRHLVALKERATEVESHGKNGKALREHYKTKIGLKDKDADLLDQIAAECERETAKVDAKAQRIIDNVRRRFPKGELASPDQLPPPPDELKKLQLKRDMIVMRARHRLVTELGKQTFQQIDDYLKVNFAPDVRPVAGSTRWGSQTKPPGGDQ
jgi:hypothetical protein